MPPQHVPTRSWGTRFDTLPSSPPPLSPPVQESASAVSFGSVSDSSSKRKDDKLPHDASVFVGSLPSNIDHAELTRMLADHLSEHTQINNIKVVRDSKGGVCAFVQCQNAEAASALIQTLHSNEPKPFLGRLLRYEPARAFRTLLVSYRAPIQAIGHRLDHTSQTKDTQVIELALPSAMRMWKPNPSRFFNIIYNGDAVNAEARAAAQADSPLRDISIFLQPVEYNADTIRKLATFFGPLEDFGLYPGVSHADNKAHEDDVTWKSYPVPHNAPRSAVMDKSCWEIKWEHRDDCVSALMTLRRVPHLTVTWAHQPPTFGFENRPGNLGPNINPTPYPLHPQDNSVLEHRSFSLQTSPSHVSTGLALHQRNTREPGVQLQARDTKPPSQDASEELRGVTPTERFGWTNTDFPPLGGPPAGGTQKWKAWSETIEEELRDSSALGSDVLKSVPDVNGQELVVPETPGLEMSPTTPRTPGPIYPLTPNNGEDLRSELCELKEHPYFHTPRPNRELDPTTLFVGGLEMFGPGAWDEEKVRRFFSRFGGLESVKLVKPTNSCAAFAFVKFDNTESPARAVYEEHNRVYEGRAMRVQLRDCNPPRSPWKLNRGRGRFQNQDQFSPRKFILPDGFGDKSSFNIGQDQVISPSHADTLESSFAPERSKDTVSLGNQRDSDLSVVPHSQKLDERLSADAPSGPAAQQDRSPDSLPTSHKTENYREWYDDLESPANAPTSPSFNSLASVNTPFTPSPYPYPLSSSPYYSAMPPWVHPYAQQPPYPIPFYNGYPVYPSHLPPPPPGFATPPGSDANGPAGGQGWPPVGMYGSYIPYPMHPPRAQGTDQAPQRVSGQAPLMPTGFIQNDQGTLIAMYQPEALDQYMAGAGVAYPGGPPRLQNSSGTPWPHYTYPYPPRHPIPAPPSQHAATNSGWNHPGQSLPPQAVGQITQNSNSQHANPGGGTVERNNANPPQSITTHRRQGRRDSQLMVNTSRNNPRGFVGRHSRVNVQPPVLNFQGTGSQMTRSSGGSAEWNQWGSKT